MSKLEELIRELCPDGVETRGLGELCRIRTGKLNANAMDEDGKYPFFTCDANPYRINAFAFDTSAILISGNGSQVGHLNKYEGKFNAYQRTYVLDEFKDVEKDYLYHFMGAYIREYILINSKKGSVPYITLPMLQNFFVAVPPIEIQREIVRILDNFTELTAELTAELSLRKKQYEYYEYKVLFDKKYKRMQLHDLCVVNQGLQIPISKRKKTSGENCYRYITVQFLKNKDEEQYYIESPDPNVICRKDDILVTRTGSTGVIVSGVEGCFHNNFFKVTPNEKIDKRYMYYLLKSKHMFNRMLTVASGGTVPDLPHKKFYALEVPVPSLEEQKNIVTILERFNDLTSDISIGLPAEIEARQKQYEYYRDKLLTFKEISA